jgi:cell division protein FtsQ
MIEFLKVTLMWNDHQALNFLANILLTGVLLATIYAVGARVLTLPFFSLREIRVEGIGDTQAEQVSLTHVTRAQIEQIVSNTVSKNFMTIDLKSLQTAFKELPWVRSAKILREWPPSLRVLLEEHIALAYWGRTALINTHGELFHAMTEDIHLPVFVGPNAINSPLITRQYKVFNELLQPVEQRAVEVVLTPRHAWHVRLNTGTWLKLGRVQIEPRLNRYVSVYMQHSEILNQHQTLAYVDLRYASGFAVRKPSNDSRTLSQSGGAW